MSDKSIILNHKIEHFIRKTCRTICFHQKNCTTCPIMLQSMKLTTTLLLLFYILIVFSGCSHSSLQNYTPSAAIETTAQVEKIIVIEPEDERPLKGNSIVGKRALVWIPGVLYSHCQVAPEMYKHYQKVPFRKELGETIAKDLQKSGIAKNVVYQDKLEDSINLSKGTYVLRTKIKEGIWHRYVTMYGLSFAGFLLDLTLLPNSYGYIQLDIEAELSDSNGKMLNHELLMAKQNVTYHLYYKNFHPNLAKAYGKISPQLRSFVAAGHNM